jgi:hypothetical protein
MDFDHLCSTQDFIRVTKSRRFRWVGHVALTGEKRKSYKKLGSIISKWIGKKTGLEGVE